MNLFGMPEGGIATNLFFFVLLVWTIFWRGIGLWRAANNRQRNWFVAMLVLQTVGILEIVYLFRFCKKPLTIKELRSWFSGIK